MASLGTKRNSKWQWVTPFPKMMLAMGNCMWGEKRKMVAALPLVSLVAAAPLVYVADTLGQLVFGQGLELVEGLHLPVGGRWQGSQLRWLRLCLLTSARCCWRLPQLRGVGPLDSSLPSLSAALQLQIDVTKLTLKQFLVVKLSCSFCSNSCYCCEHRKLTWNNPLWRSGGNRD